MILRRRNNAQKMVNRRIRPVVTVLEDRAVPAVYTVTSIADNGTGSIRDALNMANSSPGADTIKFSIGTGIKSIALASPLPDITDAVTIDATTQPGYAGKPIIELNGTNAGSGPGFKVTGGSTTIKGLIINRFSGQGIWLYGGGSNTVQNCWIGVNTAGSAAATNSGDGIFIDKSSGNTIGGASSTERNVISGNSGQGIHFLFNGQANNNLMEGNYIGTDVTGTYAVGNSGSGIDFFGPATFNTMRNNVISGNGGNGITFFGGDATDNLIIGNMIGVDVTGTRGVPNSRTGVDVWGPPRITIKNNVISANKGAGISVNSNYVTIVGNIIGTDINKTTNLGNLDEGIKVGGLGNPIDTRIGGPNYSDGNVIANNGSFWIRSGISVTSGAKTVLIFNNTIYDNALMGIDLNSDGKVNLNDTGDSDTGANDLLNFPVITAAVAGTGRVTVAGTYNGLASTAFTLQFFASNVADTTGYGEGKNLLGSAEIFTDVNGNATFSTFFNSSQVPLGSKISATATMTGNGPGTGLTSEFCQSVAVTPAPSADLAVTVQPVTGAILGTNYQYTIQVTNNGPNAVQGVTVLDALPAGLVFISSSATATIDSENVVAMDAGTLAVGASKTITLTVLPTAFGNISTGVSAVGLNTDPNPNNSSITHIAIVADKPGQFQFESANLQVGEWESVATIRVNRVNGSGGAASISYTIAGATAKAVSDYSGPASGILNFANGQSTATFTIPIVNDSLYEGNETLNLALLNPTGNTTLGSPATASLSILDDDAIPTFSIDDVTQSEGTGPGQSITFTVTLSDPSGIAASVNYATTAGTASANSDFTPVASILVFSPGEVSKTVTIAIVGDQIQENDELFYVDLTAPNNASISDSRGVGTLQNDDAAPLISVADSSVTEGTGSTAQMSFNVILNVASSLPVTVKYATANGTALSGSDYGAASGTLTFQPGDISKTVKINISGDSLHESDETFSFNLNTPTNATIDRDSAIGTIVNNDAMPGVSIDNTSVTEPDTGSSTNAIFTVKLATASGLPVSVQVDTVDGTAKAGSDYTATSQTIVFSPGTTTKTFAVPILGDKLFEETEEFAFQLSNVTGAVITPGSGTATILDNDAQILLNISDAIVTEGDTGTSFATFNVSLSSACEADIRVNYATQNDTATAGLDYTATTGQLVILAGQTTAVIQVPVLNDTVAEPFEKKFKLQLTSPVNVNLQQTFATGIIQDNDSAGTFAFDQPGYQVAENVAGGVVVLTVTRTNGTNGSVTIPYTVASGSAVAGQDFNGASGTVSFAAGQQSATISIPIINDTLVESPETFSVILGTPSTTAATLGAVSTASVTIVSEDIAIPVTKITSVKPVLSRGTMTTINIVFSSDLDANSIKNLASYTLVAAGRDKKFGTKDDTKYKMSKVSYNASTKTLTLTHAKITLTGDLQLTVSGSGSTTLKDRGGNAIDGNRDGKAGGNAVIKISKSGVATF